MAEIQENSNLPYRMFDYNRLDKNGIPRQLAAGCFNDKNNNSIAFVFRQNKQ